MLFPHFDTFRKKSILELCCKAVAAGMAVIGRILREKVVDCLGEVAKNGLVTTLLLQRGVMSSVRLSVSPF